MQTENPFLDGVARIFTDAAGAAQSVRSEIDTSLRQKTQMFALRVEATPHESLQQIAEQTAQAAGTRITIINSDGKVLADTSRARHDSLRPPAAVLHSNSEPPQPASGAPISETRS